jgi:enamine deaminase RidA (YjgF/YER057c/UK114 family)
MLQRTPMLAPFLLLLLAAPAFDSQKKKNEEPKSQVLPLPPELPMALVAETETLDFHISPLLRSGGLAAQIRQSLGDLVRDTHGETIVKLRAFVAGAGDARRVQAEATDLFTEHRLPLPVVSVLQVGALGDEAAKVVIEAVVSTRKTVNPSGLAFMAGQTGASLKEAEGKLAASAQAAGVAPDKVLTTTCFTAMMEDYGATRANLLAIFPNTSVNVVQALRDPSNDSSMCEAIGQLAAPPAKDVVFLSDKRVTLVGPRRLIFTGLQLTFGSFLDDAQESFLRLRRAAKAFGAADMAVQVNAFSLNAYAGSALRKQPRSRKTPSPSNASKDCRPSTPQRELKQSWPPKSPGSRIETENQ